MAGNLAADPRFLLVRKLLDELRREHKLTDDQLNNLLKAELRLPISLFSTGLSVYELACRYLIDNEAKRPSDVARLTGRSRQAVYQAYRSAKAKHPLALQPSVSPYDIPLSVIAAKDAPPLAAVCRYLRSLGCSYADIARLLHRDQRTVHTSVNRP